MNIIIFIGTYFLLALIHVGIFYAWDYFLFSAIPGYEFIYMIHGLFFPAIWIFIILFNFLLIPIKIIDFIKECGQ